MIGQTVAHYRITAKLGEGGMGAVYRARDTKLDRDVAIKILPRPFAADAGRMARFEREAKVLASLNHPNIAHIYGVEERALVMELVEGESPKGPLPFDEAWKIALQIADALEYAHEKGVIHRDLKPANVKVTPDGVVKLLDFGLAKAFSETPEVGNPDPENSPTITLGATVAGTVLGTAAYMSPEQAKGKRVDKRADIWSWGVVLYELLAGERLFKGGDATDTLAQVLTKEPLLERVPPQVRKLLERCLEKDPKQRLRDIGEARFLLESDHPLQASSGLYSRLAWAIAAVATIAAIGVGFLHFREVRPTPELVRFQIDLPENMRDTAPGTFSVSPDGRNLMFVATGSDGVSRLWLRSLDSISIKPVLGSEGASSTALPVWSPDSRDIVLPLGGKLRRISVTGGQPQTLCNLPPLAHGGSWNQDGVILIGTQRGVLRVSNSGGDPVPVTVPDSAAGETYHYSPVFLPDGRHFLYLRVSPPTSANSGVYLGSLDAKPEQQSIKRLFATNFDFLFVPSVDSFNANGYVLFIREGSLIVQTFDTKKFELTGEPVAIAEQVVGGDSIGGLSNFYASPKGTLIYRASGAGGEQFQWFDRYGHPLGKVGGEGAYQEFSVAPDGKRVAVAEVRGGSEDIYIIDGAHKSKLTSGGGVNLGPRWSPDGDRIAFTSGRNGHLDIYVKDTAGTNDGVVLKSNNSNVKVTTSWCGDKLLYLELDPKTRLDTWVLPLTRDGKPMPYLHTDAGEGPSDFSPDCHWIAYASTESGTSEIYVRPFPRTSDIEWPVSTNGGATVRWRANGKELFYRTQTGKLMAVTVTSTDKEFKADAPVDLFEVPPVPGVAGTWFDISRDGQQFLLKIPAEQRANQPFTVVLNWQVALKR